MKQKFNIGDKVVLKDYETLCKCRHVSSNNEVFERHYKYLKSKEPLEICRVWEPGSMLYSMECDDPELRGEPLKEYLYNFQTPRSDLYLCSGDELDLYVEEPEVSE